MYPNEAESTSGASGTPSSPAAAPAATPASTPAAPAPKADNAVEGAEPTVDWAAETDLGDENENATPAKPAAAPATPAAPAKPAEVAPAAPAAAVPAPAVGAEPAKPADKPTAPVAAQPPAKPAEVAAETPEAKAAREVAEKAEEEKLFNGLVEYYKLPDDMAVKLATEPELVLPHLAARVHQAVSRQAMQVLAQQLPRQIMAVMQFQQKESESKSAFYRAWPQLAPHEEQVLKAGEMFRRMNPTATAEEAIQAIGRIVVASLNLAPPPVSGAAAAPAAAAPAFTPTGASGSRSAAPAVEENEFAKLAMED